MQTFDVFILILRIVFIFLIYFFLFLVVRIVARELNTSNRGRRAPAAQTPELYPEEGMTGMHTAIAQPGTVSGRLLTTEIGNATTIQSGAIFELGPVTPIGRKATNAIRLDDDFVSGEHALLAWRGGRWFISDVASTNGTFVNGEQVTQPRVLNWGDQIGIGRVKFRLEP